MVREFEPVDAGGCAPPILASKMTSDAAVAWAMTDYQADGPMTIFTRNREQAEFYVAHGLEVDPLYSATTVAELRAEVAYYKENFLSCMATLNAINNAITEADEEGRGFVPVHQLTAALTKESP